MTKRYGMTPPKDQEVFWGKEWKLEDELMAKLDKRPLTLQEIKASCAVFLKKVFE
jgi:hypothetical protein